MNYIEQRFKDRTTACIEGKEYSKQWELAKDYLPQILETISHTFPHYSLHNSSHSETILNNIVRLVGPETIDKLSIVDLWLLLSSAYFHDCGMFVTAEDKKIIFEDDKLFVSYIKEKQADKASPMNVYANLLEIKADKLYYANGLLTAKSYDGVKFLLADFIRTQHATRSAEKIAQSSSLHLPGSPIPERVIHILENVCRAHTQTHKDILQLPFAESSGCGIENCHPLYIACLLRLGDLLDIDNNRISDVLLSTLSSIPADSKLYNDSNRAITHLRIDKSVIEITAICEQYEVADLTNKWFHWLNEELIFQMKNWHKIVPDISYGYLPTAGELKVELKEFDTFDGKNRPSFRIDPQKAIELLQGAGLYSEPCQSIRELLQNAIDATYIKIWKLWEQNQTSTTFHQFEKDCQETSIEIRIKRAGDLDPEFVSWQIEIQDHGIGMSKNDLEVLANTGSRNKNKLRIIDSMPEWMKPSGTFGIGFQSVFLLADQIEIDTRKLYANQSYKVLLNNPINKENGAILIKTTSDSTSPFGTTLRFTTKQPRRPGWSVHNGEQTTLSIINSFDFALDSSLDVAIGKIIDEINKVSCYSYIPIKLFYEGSTIALCHRDKSEETALFDKENQMEVTFTGLNYNTLVYYRNQLIKDHPLDFLFLGWKINILDGNAKDILTLDRNKIQSSFRQNLQTTATKSIIKYLRFNFTKLPREQQPYASMFLEVYAEAEEHKDEEKQWRNVRIELKKGGDPGNMMIGEVLDSIISVKSVQGSNGLPVLEFNLQNGYWSYFQVANNSIQRDVFKFVCYILKSVCRYISYQEDGIHLSKEKMDYIYCTEKAKLKFMKSHLYWHYSRFCMPCNEKYHNLEVDDNVPDNDMTFSDFNIEYPIMVSPYIKHFKDDTSMYAHVDSLIWSANEQFYDYIFAHRKDKNVTKEQIAQAYDAFKEEYQPIVEKINNEYIEKYKVK